MNAMISMYDVNDVELRNRRICRLDCGEEYHAAELVLKDKQGKELVINLYSEDLTCDLSVSEVGEIKDKR